MKKFIPAILLLSTVSLHAQLKTWEYLDYDAYKDSLNFQKSYNTYITPDFNPKTDQFGNNWSFSNNNQILTKANETNTVVFDNFPLTYPRTIGFDTNYEGDVIFVIEKYRSNPQGGPSGYINYIGYYDGTSLSFYDDESFGLANYTLNDYQFAKQIKDFAFFVREDQLIKLDKSGPLFSVIPSNSSTFNGLDKPVLASNDSTFILLINKGQLFEFTNATNTWQNLSVTDSISKVQRVGKDEMRLFGQEYIYDYSPDGLDSISYANDLGQLWNLKNLDQDVHLLDQAKGLTIYDHGQLFDISFPDNLPDANFNLIGSFFDEETGKFVFVYNERTLRKTLVYTYNAQDGLTEIGLYNISIFNIDHLDYGETNSGESLLAIADYAQPNARITLYQPGKDSILYTDQGFFYIYGVNIQGGYLHGLNETNEVPLVRTKIGEYYYRGRVYYDANENNFYNYDELPYDNMALTIQPSGLRIFPASDGSFAFRGQPSETYTLEIPGDSIFDHVSVSLPYTFSSLGLNDIGVTLKEEKPDIHSNFWVRRSRCNTSSTSSINVVNNGFLPVEKVSLGLVPDPLLEVTSDQIDYTSSDTLFFTIDNLAAKTDSIIHFEVTWPAEQFTGDTLRLALTTAVYENNNVVDYQVDSLQTLVRCSYDPNDKAVNPIGVTDDHFTLKTSDLTYLVRFENTGNDTAYHVTVYDTLSTAFDMATFEELGSSHSHITQIDENGVLSFHFEDIMLPDSTTDKEGAQGYVRFKVSPKPTISDFTVVENTAAIVFDANAPIITNMTWNTMVSSLPKVTGFWENDHVSTSVFYPNPAVEHVYSKNEAVDNIQVFDMHGRFLLHSDNKSVNVQTLETGVYLFKGYENGSLIVTDKVMVE